MSNLQPSRVGLKTKVFGRLDRCYGEYSLFVLLYCLLFLFIRYPMYVSSQDDDLSWSLLQFGLFYSAPVAVSDALRRGRFDILDWFES
jgi:hypothetical protein